jgi:catechol 2,3-dioxygenase-like lactoylglutathione lyase family enzyme
LFEIAGVGLELEVAGAGEREGVAGLVFAVDDLEASAEDLAARGIALGPPREESGGRRSALDSGSTRGISLELWQGAGAPSSQSSVDSVEVEALDHVVVMTADHAAAIRLFGEALGLRLALDRSFPERGVRLLFFRTAGVTIEVGGPLEAPEEPEPIDRFYGLAWRAADILAWRERLLREGFEVSGHRPGNKRGTRVCSVKSRTGGVPTLLVGPDLELLASGSV